MEDGLQTPMMNNLGRQMAEEMNLDLGKIGDWENVEKHPRDGNCVITYGVKGGIAFYRKTQTDMDIWNQVASEKRLAFSNTQGSQRANKMGIACYALPQILLDEIEISGVPVREILASSDHSDLDAIMIEFYPNLLWVPVKYLRGRYSKTYLPLDSIRTDYKPKK